MSAPFYSPIDMQEIVHNPPGFENEPASYTEPVPISTYQENQSDQFKPSLQEKDEFWENGFNRQEAGENQEQHNETKENGKRSVDNSSFTHGETDLNELPAIPPVSTGQGLPYAPVDWPCPGDVWSWRVGRKVTATGHHEDRFLILPQRLQAKNVPKSFASKATLAKYIQANFPDLDADSFFASFSWKIPALFQPANKVDAVPSSQNHKSRWSSKNNDGGASNNNNSKESKASTAGQKITDKKHPRPNPSPKLPQISNQFKSNHPNPAAPSSSRPMVPFPFPDSSAALGPPPPPTYGFHMLERRTIVLADGSVRSYFALPPNYMEFPPPGRLAGPEFGGFPPFHPEEFRDQRQHRNRPEGSMKRKYPGEEEFDRRDERADMLRQRQQFMQHANPNDHSLMACTSRQLGEDGRSAKHMRIGSSRHESGVSRLTRLH